MFIGIEVITSKAKINKELSRKFAHILSGVSVAFLPFVMSFPEIMVLALLFLPVMLISKRNNLFSSIHEVSRTTYGEVYFPVTIFLTALLFPDIKIFMFGILVMSISDGLASVIGQKFGKKKYHVWNGDKSYVGSTTFLISTFVLGIILLPGRTYMEIVAIIVCSMILTLVEAGLAYGFDNLLIPPIAASLFALLTR
jgi:phytol kinase